MTNTLTNDLKVISWNAQSILPKLYETVAYFELNPYDVICISETWLKNSQKLYFPSYFLYRVDRQSGEGGGILIAVNRKLKHVLLPSLNTKAIESIAVCIETLAGPVTFVSVYFPGSDLSSQNLSVFKADIKILTSIKNSFFVCGDFNAKHRFWNNLRANSAGNIIYEELNNRPFMVYNSPTPTCFPPQAGRKPSNIDIVLSNCLHNHTQVLSNHDLMSDHCAIEFVVNCSAAKSFHTAKRFRFDLADWKGFQDHVNSEIDLNGVQLNSGDEIDAEVDKFTKIISDAMNLSIPKRTKKVGCLQLPPELIHMITTNRTIKRRYKRHRNPDDLKLAKNLAKKIESEVLKHKNRNFNNTLENLDYASGKFWRLTKLIKNKSANMRPLKNDMGQLVYTNSEKAHEIGKAIHCSHLLTSNMIHNSTTKLVNRSIKRINDAQLVSDDVAQLLTSPSEIKKLIRALKAKKSPGDDAISNKVIKKLPFRATVLLTKIVNACLQLGYFPKDWKTAKVIAILKPNKVPTEPSSYRPISLLSSLSKILEKIILKRINDHSERCHIIPHHQFGFKNGHSTVHQLFRVVKMVKTNFARKRSTGMFLLDIEKAFDTIWHNGLLHKLLSFDFPIPLIKIIQSFLSNRSYYVNICGARSCNFEIPAGLPQGSSLSPSLYNIHTSDLKVPRNTSLAQFADDTAVSCSGKKPGRISRTLEKSFTSISKYYRKWRIQVNKQKTSAVYFSRKRSSRFLPVSGLNLDGTTVPWSRSVKYLGVLLDPKLHFNEHTSYLQTKALKCIRILYSLINKKSKLNLRNKLLIFKSVFRPILTYAGPVWGNCAKIYLRRLQIAQNKFLKLVLKKPFNFSTNKLHVEAKVNLLNEALCVLSEKFINNCRFSDNLLISSLPS